MDFAPNWTPRMIYGYTSAGIAHHVMVRVTRGTSLATANGSCNTVLQGVTTALANLLPTDFLWTDSQFIPEDSDVAAPGISLPANPTGLMDVADYSHNMRATETTFIGKGGGSRVTLSIFGVFWVLSDPTSPASNGKVNVTESTPVSNAIASLAGSSTPKTIADAPVTWAKYATVKVNDHWLKEVRKLFV